VENKKLIASSNHGVLDGLFDKKSNKLKTKQKIKKRRII